jgi:hypothetical protein
MTVGIQEAMGAGYLEIDLSGKLAKEDYMVLRPRFEELLKDHGKVRLLVRMHDFHGWTAGGLWEDLKFDAKHFNDIERIAFVGDKKWEETMSTFCKPFTTAKTRFFYEDQLEAARSWLRE